MDKISYINGLVLNIYEDNDTQALIKVLTKNQIIYLISKGFFKNTSKNKSQIKIGSISNFEILDNYGKGNKKLLKKAQIKFELDLVKIKDINFYKKLVKILQLIEEPSLKLWNFYQLFIMEINSNYKHQFLTYLLNIILETKGQKLIFQKCVNCESNKNLYMFNSKEGGMFCIKCKLDYGLNDLKILKSIIKLDSNFDEYKTTPKEIDKKIFEYLFKNHY